MSLADSDYQYDLPLFSAYGVEVEYMIVDAQTLDVCPLAELVLAAEGGEGASDVLPSELGGAIEWSNELTAHVIEFKTALPAPTLDGLDERLHESVRLANSILRDHGAMLLPTAMHPWMNPDREMVLWPLGYRNVYELLDRIFSCRGHGWANLQSVHINLPFADDREFGRLHAAIRCILPLIPALAAASPFADGRVTGLRDTRLETYRTNSKAIPACAARVIPEPIFTRAEYEREVFGRIDHELAPHDPDRLLHHEWMNARGCIARFMRGAIEIRLIDVQECPSSDLAVARLVTETVRALTEERASSTDTQRELDVDSLHDVMLACIREGEGARVDHPQLLKALGISHATMRAGDLWKEFRSRWLTAAGPWDGPLDLIEHHGTLATRMLHDLGWTEGRVQGEPPDRQRLFELFQRLAKGLDMNHPFAPDIRR